MALLAIANLVGVSLGVCVTFNWLFNMIGAEYNFLFFAVMTALAYLFATKLLPETKGRSLEQIERDLTGPAAATT